MNKYFVFVQALGKSTTIGTIPAIATIGHFQLNSNGSVNSYWEQHSYADNKPLIPTTAIGPYGVVYRPNPSAVYTNPHFKLAWKELTTEKFEVSIGSVVYQWTLVDSISGRYELTEIDGISGQWISGFGYFTEELVYKTPLIYNPNGDYTSNCIANSYAGEQYQSAEGIWDENRVGCGISTYMFIPSTNLSIATLSQDPGDGTGLMDLETLALNVGPKSRFSIVCYGGHDFSGDGKMDPVNDGGHSFLGLFVIQNSKPTALVYLENSHQISPAGNILCIAYLIGEFYSN